jgi:hypothetical protein
MAQSVDKCAACAVGIDAGATEGAQDAVLHDAAGDAVCIGTHKQRRRRRPGGQSPAGGGALLGCGGESGAAAVEIILDDLDQRRFDRHPD